MLESKLRADFEPKGGLGNLLSSFDEFYIHQTSRPIATPATSDRNAYDRSLFPPMAIQQMDISILGLVLLATRTWVSKTVR